MLNLKEIFENDSWTITKVSQGRGQHRIDAKRRFPVADESNFFSKWGSNKYLNQLSQENYGKKLNEFSNYIY
jgi:hypothetical protein